MGLTPHSQKVLTLFHVCQSNFLELPSQAAFRAHAPFHSLHAPILFLAISPSLTLLFYSLNGNEGLFFTYPLLVISQTCTSHVLSFSKWYPTILSYAASCFRILTTPVTLHPLGLQWCDRDHIFSDFLIQDEGSPSSHTDIMMFLFFVFYSFPKCS